jgi:hypothetical protein
MTAKSSTSSPFKANLIPRRISKANAVHSRGYYFLKVSPSSLFHRSTTSQQVTSYPETLLNIYRNRSKPARLWQQVHNLTRLNTGRLYFLTVLWDIKDALNAAVTSLICRLFERHWVRRSARKPGDLTGHPYYFQANAFDLSSKNVTD